MSAEINNSIVEKTVSRKTISKLLRKKELNLFYAVRKPLLMLTNHQKQKKWCKERLNYSMEQWKMIIFSDELNFKIINRKNKRFVCHKNTEKYLKQHMQSRIQKGGGSVGIWGCISGSGIGCHKICERILNQYGYRDILENLLIPSRNIFQADQNWLFQQDNAPCHSTHSITNYFVESNILLLPWPALKPDQKFMELDGLLTHKKANNSS